MILLSGVELPPELDGERSAPLPAVRDLRKLPRGPHVAICGGAGARALVPWIQSPEALASLEAVLLVEPDTGGIPPASMVPWRQLAARAIESRILVTIWATHGTPQIPRRRHPYDAVWLLAQQGRESRQAPTLRPDTGALLDWPAGEILSTGDGAWTAPPEIQIDAWGALVLIVDRESQSSGLALTYGPGALVRGVLSHWPRGTLRSMERAALEPLAPRRRSVADQAREASRELDDVIDGAEALGRSVARGGKAAIGAIEGVREFWRRLRSP